MALPQLGAFLPALERVSQVPASAAEAECVAASCYALDQQWQLQKEERLELVWQGLLCADLLLPDMGCAAIATLVLGAPSQKRMLNAAAQWAYSGRMRRRKCS